MSIDDWRYEDEKMKVREQALKILLSKYGGQMDGPTPKYSSQSIYECAQRLGVARQYALRGDCKILRGLLCKKVINVLAVLSFVGTAGIVGTAGAFM